MEPANISLRTLDWRQIIAAAAQTVAAVSQARALTRTGNPLNAVGTEAAHERTEAERAQWTRVQRRIAESLQHTSRTPKLASLRTAIMWLAQLPVGLRVLPEIGFGDDGSVAVEWDTGTAQFVALFDGTRREASFESDGGDEWETDLSAGLDKIHRAVLVVAY